MWLYFEKTTLFDVLALLPLQVFTVALISVLRCVVSMTVNAAIPAGDYADRVSEENIKSARFIFE